MSSKKSLGRGLGAILGEVSAAYEKEVPQNEIVEIDVDAVRTNPFQPRRHFDEESLQELAESIKAHGLLQPVVVIEDLDGYVLIAGERRLRASKMAGLSKIKAIIADIDRAKFREFALIENIQREELQPLDLAHSYKELIEEYGITQEQLASIVKKSRAHIANTLRLLGLCDYTKAALQEGKITPGHAKVLVGLDEAEQKVLTDTAVGQKLSVRELERLVQKNKSDSVTKSDNKRSPSKELEELAQKLKTLGFKAKAVRNGIQILLEEEKEILRFSERFS